MAGIVQSYDDVVMKKVADFVKVSDKIGGDVKQQAGNAKEAFNAQRDFIEKVSGHAKPSQDDLGKMLNPTSEKMAKVEQFQSANRTSAHFNHIKGISEAVSSLQWVAVPSKPLDIIKSAVDSTTFYTNRVLKDFKKDHPEHGEWVDALIAVLDGLKSYVNNHHNNGLKWGK